jgi:UDP-N-acetylmuramate--alanine ligase
MSGLARILVQSGVEVSGSDLNPSAVVEDLERAGVNVYIGHRPEFLHPSVETVVRSAAVPETNPEVAAARRRGVPVLRFSEMLGRCLVGREGIAVAGTHGKTTTTAMISHVLLACGADPSYLVGGLLPDGSGNARRGRGEHFVTEACEYAESFLDLTPRVAVITNVEPDHLDYYGNFGNVLGAFERFLGNLPEDGRVIINADDHEAMAVAVRAARCRVETFGIEAGAGLKARNLRQRRGRYAFELHGAGSPQRVMLLVPGRHNVHNALAAASVCLEAGVDPKEIAWALSNFEGVKRRFEVVGRIANTTVISDYAHHPTEIRAALSCARKTMPHRRVFCIFQPHQGSRTRFLMKEFASAFIQADVVLLPDIYYVRDAEDEASRVTSRDLLREIRAFGTRCEHLPRFEQIVDYLRANVRRGDVIMAVGAGSIEDLPARVVRMLKAKFGTRRVAQARRRFLPRTFEQIREKLRRRRVEAPVVGSMAYAT